MFRNVTGVQEAVVHRQSENSLIHENHEIKLIKDVQSDNIAQTYPILKTKWFNEREKLIQNLKYLQKYESFSDEIQHIKNLIECLNELIDNGEINKNCQILINEMKKTIQPLPEKYLLNKKLLGNKIIRLPRHISKTNINLLNPFKKITSEILHIKQSNEQLHHPQIDHHEDTKQEQQIDDITNTDETLTSSTSSDKLKNGMKYYVIAEQFRPEKSRKKHYLTSSIIE